jgi:oligosaccharide repeat unit polymerase
MIHRLGFLPAFSDNPNLSRMSFNLPYVNVAAWCFVSALYLLSGFGWIILKKRKYLFFTGYSLAFYFVFASRSGIICLILMLVILFSLSKMTNGRLEFFSKKVVVYFSLVLFACTVLGELRMSNSHFDIVKYGSFRTNNVVLAWVYGYVFVNLDNLQLSLKHDSPYYRGVHTFQAINPFLGIHTDQTLMDEYHYIGKFNLGTGFRDYYLDWGMLGAPIVLILVWLSYILFGRLFRTDLLIVYTSYIIQQIIMFLLDDRFSSFLMIFSVCVLLFYDRFLTKRQTIMRSLSTLS